MSQLIGLVAVLILSVPLMALARRLERKRAAGHSSGLGGAQALDPESLAAIFEPFYTTKEKGKATGLGLALAQNLVADLAAVATPSPTTGGSLLLVEEDSRSRELLRAALSRVGYPVH